MMKRLLGPTSRIKTVFVIAGFDLDETATCEDYRWLIDGIKAKGYKVVPVDISWRHKTPGQYMKEFERLYEQQKTEINIIIGNSFGAVVAFLSAAELKPDAIYLCSMSPFFKEDRGRFPDSYPLRHFGKRRVEELWSYSAKMIAEDINSADVSVNILYGENEQKTSPNLVARAKATAKDIKDAKLIEVPGAPHQLEDRVYGSALIEML